jgi:hypothetical protein
MEYRRAAEADAAASAVPAAPPDSPGFPDPLACQASLGTLAFPAIRGPGAG